MKKITVDPKHVAFLTASPGISAATIVSILTGIPTSIMDVPHDISDCGRCIKMFVLFPELKAKFEEMRIIPKWKPYIDCWPQIERLYNECIKLESSIDWKPKHAHKKKGPHSQAYHLIERIHFASRYLSRLRCNGSSHSWRKDHG